MKIEDKDIQMIMNVTSLSLDKDLERYFYSNNGYIYQKRVGNRTFVVKPLLSHFFPLTLR